MKTDKKKKHCTKEDDWNDKCVAMKKNYIPLYNSITLQTLDVCFEK